MRHLLTLLHRWFGLFTAVFLFVAGATGAIISWDHELDGALNPQMYHAQWQGEAQSPLVLADRFEAENPNLIVTFLPLELAAGDALNIFVKGRSEQADQNLTYNQVAIHPESGEVQAKRMWGDVSLSRENLLPFLYKLHYSMHLPDVGGIEAGILFMGIVSIVWILDSFVAIAISFPARRSWQKSFLFRWKSGGYKLNFDLHRSGGVWVWALLLIIAVTSVSMNLGFQVVRPVVNAISPLTPSPFETQTFNAYSTPALSRAEAVELARIEAPKHDITDPIGGLFYARDYNLYGIGFFTPGNSHGDGGLGNPWLYFDGNTGAYVGATIPGEGSAGDIFMQAQFPLHSGRILGVTGRVIMSFLGALIAMLSITGIVIWARKRKARAIRSKTA
ncbi:PepSY-associated TM helix domain-containing protein [Teredinibacter turnerae]|uniref:PepSY-associated TM helix domain-containing protein n=1 Tax=Teredinibacter turnerae TaxID=2426 RepID=UPI0030CE9B04